MRTSMGLAAASVLAVGTLGVQIAPATSAPSAPSAPSAHDTSGASAARDGTTSVDRLAARAVTALTAHPGAARGSVEQELVPRDAFSDPDGTTHVRLDRTYRGLPVLGGDLVVHQDSSGGWAGVSQTLTRKLTVTTTPRLSQASATARFS